MFVDIENPKSPLKVANILTAYDKGVVVKGVRQPKEKLTPEVCLDILKSTNHPRCIQNMLQLIAKLPDEEQVQFKEVVLSCFDNREQPKPVLDVGQELAEKSGYGIEFAQVQKIKEGLFLSSDAVALKCLMCKESEFTNEDFSAYDKVIFLSDKKIQFKSQLKLYVKFPKNMEFPNSLDVSFYDENGWGGLNLLGVQSIRFKEGAKVNLKGAKNLPDNLDVSQCLEVNLSECDLKGLSHLCFKDGAEVDLKDAKNLPADLDFSRCVMVDLLGCNLRKQLNLRFKDGAKVDLERAKKLPPNLDFSCCADISLRSSDLSEQSNLRFMEGASVDLSGVKNLPANLDFSQCNEVWLCDCDLSGQPNPRFKNGAKVVMQSAYNFSEKIDFSLCSEVVLNCCDLKDVSYLCFKDGAIVDLTFAYNLPENLDVSMCAKVDLDECDFSTVKELVFKNREQMENSHAKLPDDWKGKLVFTDEVPQNDLNLVMTAAKTKGGR